MAAVGVRLGRELARDLRLEVRIDEGEDALHVLAVEGLQAPPDDVDVLL